MTNERFVDLPDTDFFNIGVAKIRKSAVSFYEMIADYKNEKGESIPVCENFYKIDFILHMIIDGQIKEFKMCDKNEAEEIIPFLDRIIIE